MTNGDPRVGPAGRQVAGGNEHPEALTIGAVAVGLFFVAWEGLSRAEVVSPLFLSSPIRIATTAARMLASGELVEHLRVSGVEFTLGYGLAVAVAVPAGLAAGWYLRVRFALAPFIWGLNATPRVAFLPLIILWLGIGLWSKVMVIFLGAFFPICISTMSGVETVERVHLNIACTFRASQIQIFRTIVVPTALPFILTGLRLGVGRALIGIVVAEIYAASAGVGYLVMMAGSTFQTDRLFVGIAILAGFGILSDVLFSRVERRIGRWRQHVQREA
jgi:NitT/TauT family transport system permease protein